MKHEIHSKQTENRTTKILYDEIYTPQTLYLKIELCVHTDQYTDNFSDMDSYYDFDGAGEQYKSNGEGNNNTRTAVALDSLVKERSKEEGNHLANIKEVRTHQLTGLIFMRYKWRYIQMDNIIPVFNSNPPGWILTVPGARNSEHEEFVIKLQGVITQKELPPITVRYVE